MLLYMEHRAEIGLIVITAMIAAQWLVVTPIPVTHWVRWQQAQLEDYVLSYMKYLTQYGI